MTTILQIELRHYVTNHEFDAVIQNNGIAILTPVTLANGKTAAQWDYVETYRQARHVLGY